MQKKRICFLSSGAEYSLRICEQVKNFELGIVDVCNYSDIEALNFDLYDFVILSGKHSETTSIVNKYLKFYSVPLIYISHKKCNYILNNEFTVINSPLTKNNLCTAFELAVLKSQNIVQSSSSKYYQKLIQNSTDLTLIIDKDGLVSFCSPASEQILGLKRYHLIGKNILEFIFPHDHEKIIKILTNQTNDIKSLEIRFRRNENEFVWMETNFSNCLKDELICGFVLNARDISDRKELNDSYKEEKSIFQSILHNAPDSFVLFNPDGKILFLNCAFSKMTGFSDTDFENINDWIKFALPEQYENYEIIKALGGKNKHRTTKIKNRENEIVDIEYDIIELHNSELLLTMKDISKYKRSQIALSNSLDLLTANKFMLENRNDQLAELNKKLTESEKKLSELNVSKDKFFSIIAHDLRSPFNSLLGMTSLLISEFDFLNKEEILRFLNDIKSSSQNIFRLLENLLSWAKLNSGMIDFNPQKIDLFDVSSRVKGTLNYNAKHKKINLINKIKKNQYVQADEKMLHCVFQNLLSNSIKFTKDGGEVLIEAEVCGDRFYNIMVKDSGVGIRKEDLENLFRIDVNSSTRGTSNEAGSGIGLILCKEFVEKNGGEITVESEVGEGTTFTFTVPALNKSE